MENQWLASLVENVGYSPQKLVKRLHFNARRLINGTGGFDSAHTPSNWIVNSADIQETARPNPAAKSSLSESQRHLVELMQRLNFGRIEDLQVRGGEPVFDPAPRVVRKLKIGGENGPRRETVLPDFWLKQQTSEMLEAIAELGEGEILSIEVKHGLPFAMEVEQQPTSNGTRRG